MSLENLLLVHRRKREQLRVLKWQEIQKHPEKASSIHHKYTTASMGPLIHQHALATSNSLYEWFINHLASSSSLHPHSCTVTKQDRNSNKVAMPLRIQTSLSLSLFVSSQTTCVPTIQRTSPRFCQNWDDVKCYFQRTAILHFNSYRPLFVSS